MKKKTLLFALLPLLYACSGNQTDNSASVNDAEQDLLCYVDPMIGTGDHGHVFVGACVPFGMVQAGPTQEEIGWDWCSGYHYDGKKIVGFGQQHLSGTGCPDLGDIALMPVTEETVLTRSGLATPFSHDDETVRPDYYKIKLPQATVEITASAYSAGYRIAGSDLLAVDLKNSTKCWWDTIHTGHLDSHLQLLNDSVVVGHRTHRGWVQCRTVYFYMVFNCKVKDVLNSGEIYRLALDSEDYELNVGISYESCEGAKKNLGETGRVPFDTMRAAAAAEWNTALNRVQATFQNDRDRRIFYTSLYHFMIAPMRLGHVGETPDYTTLSLWDTYRAASPLSTILFPDMQKDIARTFVKICDRQHYLPVWHLMGGETNCMVGSPGVIVLSDIVLKGFDVDQQRCFEAIRTSLDEFGREVPFMNEFGYVPYNLGPDQTVSKTLEYGIAFWCGARVAEKLGYEAECRHWDDVAQAYRRIYDKRVGFFRARAVYKNRDYDFGSDSELDKSKPSRLADYDEESFRPLTGFNPHHHTYDYTEGTPWQYLFLVPHDLDGLVELTGGRDRFIERLDSLFTTSDELNDDANPDISGLIGQYAHGNEPSHHVIYFYNMLGEQEKGNRLLRQVMTTLYDDQPAGLCGNEDCGQMSAWYLMSALGFYQVEPAGGRYYFGTPIVNEATVKMGDKTLRIVTHDNSDENINIDRVVFNGKQLDTNYIMHSDLAKGGTLEFYMKK